MANMAVACTHCTNGVAELHTQILKDHVLADWHRAYPDRIQNVTNGVTPRRWLGLCDAELTSLIRSVIGEGFLRDLDRIGYLKGHIDDALAARFNEVKLAKKRQLSEHIRRAEGVEIPPEFVFDVQVKRAHEYKRQLLNALGLADLYFDIKNGELTDLPPTAFIFGAKAAPGYRRAKAVIRYINRLANLVNNDPAVNGKMRIVFVQNYNCSYAELIIPAADISEQISTAGTEASGTGVMKLMLDGAVTLGTMDGATVEIVRRAGEENNYIFGARVEEINALRPNYDPKGIFDSDWRVRRAVNTLVDGTVDTDNDQRELFNSLLYGESWQRPDNYFVLKDFPSYRETRLRAIRDWTDRIGFARKCLYNVAAAGYFSSDRAVRMYAENIWNI
jgi:starch phosphorylase